jgi:hypothetical protein
MAPVTGGIADRDQNRLVSGARRGKRFFSPGIPVHRILGMLQKVGAGRKDEAVEGGAAVSGKGGAVDLEQTRDAVIAGNGFGIGHFVLRRQCRSPFCGVMRYVKI